MTEETGAAAPTTEQASNAPAATEQATQNAGIRDVDAAPEAEAVPSTEATEETTDVTESEREAEEKKRGLSRAQRRTLAYHKAKAENYELKEQIARLQESSSNPKTDTGPNPTDYPGGEWDAQFIKDTASFAGKQGAREQFAAAKAREQQINDAIRREEINEEISAHVDRVRKLAPDYDKSLRELGIAGGITKQVEQVFDRDPEGAAEIAYYLSKNLNVARELNAIDDPIEVALEVARLKPLARESLPKPKLQTQAPAPLSSLKGGASPSKDPYVLAKNDDATAYWAARKAQEKAGA